MSGWDEDAVFWPDLTLEAVEEDVAMITTAHDCHPDSITTPEIQLLFDQVDVRLSQLRYCLDASRAESLLVMCKTLENPQFLVDDLCVTSRPSFRNFPAESESSEYIDRCLAPTLPLFITHDMFPTPDETQNAKDLARDVIRINSNLIKGSMSSYSAIKEELSRITGSTNIASRALHAAARTFSGGVCFQRVLELFEPPPPLFLIPESAEAAPLDVFACKNRALVRAHTRYSVRENEESRLCIFDAWLIAEIGEESRGVVSITSHLE